MALQLGCSLWWVSLLSTLFSHKVYRLLILKRVQRERSTRRRHQRVYHDEKTGLQSLIKILKVSLREGVVFKSSICTSDQSWPGFLLLRVRSPKDEIFLARSLCGEFFFARETFRQMKKSFGADPHVDMMLRDYDGDALMRKLTIPKTLLNLSTFHRGKVMRDDVVEPPPMSAFFRNSTPQQSVRLTPSLSVR